METIKTILGQQFRGEISKEGAVKLLTKKCTNEELADYIVEAKNRGWISNFNVGLDEDGYPI
ncbi:MAG: hypothetical protein WC291_00525 [Thermodesulfovibrionales bacterium]|jgi:hypothetical protein